MKNGPRIFVVEDDVPINTLITKFLVKQGFQQVSSYFSSEEMIPEIDHKSEIIIIQDFDLPGMNGLETIRDIKPKYPNVEFIFLSGQRSIETAMEAIRYGAFDYIVKDNFAKENVAAKIKNLQKIKKLEHDRIFFKRGFIFFSILLFLSCIILILYLINKTHFSQIN
jgi:DNA-binding NtrC family response regulator